MAEKVRPRTIIMSSDIDPAGNVTVWDHGPGYDQVPVPIGMARMDASHAITTDPKRYTLDPLSFDDPDVEAEVKRIQDKRAEALKAAEDFAAAVQLVADRKTAVASVMAARAAAMETKDLDEPATADASLEKAAVDAEALADADQKEMERIDADLSSTPEQKAAAKAKADKSRDDAVNARRAASAKPFDYPVAAG